MVNADVTRYILSLGDRDPVTRWCNRIYTECTIKGSFDPAVARNVALTVGLSGFPAVSNPFFTRSVMHRGDRIKNANNDLYVVQQVKPVWYFDEFIMNVCQADYLMQATSRAASSGTWHQDSDDVNTDPRDRVLSWLEAYVDYSAATVQHLFAGVDYPVEREFTEKGNDIVVFADPAQSQAYRDYKHTVYKYLETIELHCLALDTDTLTAVNILEGYEQAVRAADTAHAVGVAIKKITSSKPARIEVGGVYLWQLTLTVEYMRVNDEYVNSGITTTWGPSASPTGTYNIPTCTYISAPIKAPNTRLHTYGRLGGLLQKPGIPDFYITTHHDLDMEPAGYTWKRPQTVSSKTDTKKHQVFLDILFNGQLSQTYQTLNLGWGGTLKVTLEEANLTEADDNHMLVLVWAVYNSESATDYAAYFGFSS